MADTKRISALPSLSSPSVDDIIPVTDLANPATTKKATIASILALGGSQTADVQAALDGANAPDAGNPFATMADVGGGSGGITSPLDISGQVDSAGSVLVCDLWLDASDSDTITSADGAVSQWDDKSGAGNHATQDTSENQPTTGGATIDGKNVLSFDGAASFMDSGCLAYPAPIVPAGDGSSFAVFAVIRAGAVDLDSFNYAVVGDESAGNFLQLDNSASEPQLQAVNAALDLTGDLSVPQVVAWLSFEQIGATEREQVRWGRSGGVASGTAQASETAVVRIGATAGPDRYWLGDIAEVIHFSGQPDPTQVAQVEAYLRTKWGIS